jgi:hypothetical protein
MGSKVTWDVAVAFAVQDDEDTYNATLDAVTNSLQGDPDGVDDGLVLGDSESGEGGSGLSLTMGRRSRDKAPIGSSFTKGLSDFLALEARTFSFAFPFCGSRRTTTETTQVDGDFVPIVGVDAILRAAGLVGAAWPDADVGHRYVPGGSEVMSALIYYYGNRIELKSCKVASLAIDYTPGSIAIATAEIAVGSIQAPAAKGFSIASPVLPTTLDYGTQLSVSAPVVESAGHEWNKERGWSANSLTINNAIEDLTDSNAPNGIVKEPSDQTFDLEATLFADEAAGDDPVFELNQALATVIGDLKALTYTIGTPEVSGSGLLPAVAHTVNIADPELDETGPTKLGTKAGNVVSLRARSANANEEIEIIFE